MATTISVNRLMGKWTSTTPSPRHPPRGAVVVIQEAFGVNGHIEDVTAPVRFIRLPCRGSHLFHRSGDPVLDYGNIQSVMPHIQR